MKRTMTVILGLWLMMGIGAAVRPVEVTAGICEVLQTEINSMLSQIVQTKNFIVSLQVQIAQTTDPVKKAQLLEQLAATLARLSEQQQKLVALEQVFLQNGCRNPMLKVYARPENTLVASFTIPAGAKPVQTSVTCGIPYYKFIGKDGRGYWFRSSAPNVTIGGTVYTVGGSKAIHFDRGPNAETVHLCKTDTKAFKSTDYRPRLP